MNPATPSGTATLTVIAAGRKGERVISSPSGINVRVGSTASASFPVGTRITLSATDERDVVWSGDFSSDGEKVETITFTLDEDASAEANVR